MRNKQGTPPWAVKLLACACLALFVSLASAVVVLFAHSLALWVQAYKPVGIL